MAVTSAQIQELYIGYFGRPADQAGLNYWLTASNATNSTVTLNDIRASFAQQTEYTSVYGSLDRQATVSQIYQNLFGRTASADEVGYWTFTSANTPQENLIQAFLEAASTSDRAIVDAKTGFAQTLTDTYGSTATTGTTSNLRTPYNAALTAAATEQAGANPPAYITSLNAAIANASSNLNYDATNAAYNAFGATTATLNIAATATVPASLAITGEQLNSFTVAHDYGSNNTGTNNTATPPVLQAGDLAFTGDAVDNIKSLSLNLTHASVTETTGAGSVADNVNVSLAGFSALTTLNASASNVDLSLTANVPATLTNITLGSGDDTLTVATGAYSATTAAKVIAVAAGDGNDVINATVNAANVQINTGAGDDTVNLTISQATGATAQAQGNHGAEIALGAGTDKLVVTGANVQFYSGSDAAKASQLAASSVKVTDFAAGDTVAITGVTASNDTGGFTGAQLANFNAATTLVGKLDAAAVLLSGAATSLHFEFGGNTYVYADTAGAGTFGAGDTLIELTGATGLAASSFVAA
ncbi:DUF4214 domain-containing protein [Pseudomonas oryzihabitans]|uniref:DUF4214 domain-containing protein n=1 Tax=Pseudomonas oryzihabitans TaxID=47885 RepID=A0A178L556_9PSED|nr:DUF4214 domain-containing protein [Pseudomonas oryzihabitans]OAN24878.1 hypothetical protein A4V15_07430 [Pseudomonas oryzihabitans]